MNHPAIGREEFGARVARIREQLIEGDLGALLVYGDEYRKENLRYVSNFWPIFERGACIIPRCGPPILVGAPEGEPYAREMSAWDDVRNIKEFACVSVPDDIDYPLAEFATLAEILGSALGNHRRLGVVGWHDIPAPVFARVESAVPGLELEDAADLLNAMRLVKSEAEIACLREAGRLACIGYRELIRRSIPGNTELQAAGAAEGAARAAGAEDINFLVYGSGKRCDTVIGRPTRKVIADGDMIMAAFAVQYEGYVATAEFPFVAGTASPGQRDFLGILFEAANRQRTMLKAGVISGEMVKAVKEVFARHAVTEFDVYPPMHGAGLAEAESPYPDADATYPLAAGMCVNSDISLFGHPDGSNRIEEGFVIRDAEPESTTPLIRRLCEEGNVCTADIDVDGDTP